ncbi:MAG: hypothetical protein CVU42_05525 [Chloroflexi bacterium HGW-Chloroflexi-4]|jgi:AmiR/NasT family two-component response regulator|nr:MAG: hypothetical protein CVU42_05525 [Chloroflexi bacterium HGW-Chloroflexi-4]
MEIVIVSPESRRRDNLISMLESFVAPSTIKMVELCGDVEKLANPASPAIVFIDYRDPALVADKEISSLIMNHSIHYIVLLVSRNDPAVHFTHYSSCELIYDEISIDMLKNLLINVQLKSK